MKTLFKVRRLLLLLNLMAPALAQDISIPDPGFNVVVQAAWQRLEGLVAAQLDNDHYIRRPGIHL